MGKWRANAQVVLGIGTSVGNSDGMDEGEVGVSEGVGMGESKEGKG